METAIIRTGEAAKRLCVPYWKLRYLIASGRVSPHKDSAGAYVWTEDDLRRASRFLALMNGGRDEQKPY